MKNQISQIGKFCRPHKRRTLLLVGALVFLTSQTRAQLRDTSLSEILDFISASEYDVRSADESGALKAANRLQGLRFSYFDDGFAAEPRIFDPQSPKPWEYEIHLLGYAKGAASQPIGEAHWTIDRNHANARAQGITLQYANEQEGMRQNFLVSAPPAGGRALELKFNVAGSVDFAVDAGNRGLTFTDRNGNAVARYMDLHAYDATGQELSATMERRNQNEFSIVVDDAAAQYPILIDPLNVSVVIYQETQSGEYFGYVVTPFYKLGPGNRDYPGFLIGAPYWDTGSYADAGKAVAYYAFNTIPPGSSPTWTKEGDQAYGHFGASLADAGDTDGNGYDDVLVGSPDYDSGGYTDNGKAWLFKADSSGNLSTTASWSAAASQSSAHTGYAVAGLRDYNGDGYADFAVGIPDYDYNGSSDVGIVWLYKGSSSGPTADQTLYGSAGSRLGASIAAAEDIDGNGYRDFIVGMPEYNPGGGAKGGINVYLGGSGGFSVTTIPGENLGDKFGWSVAGIGNLDQNSSGYKCILVGAPYYENGQTDEGKAYIYKGTSAGIGTTPFWTAESDQAYAHFGWSVAGDPLDINGDINGDTYPDFIVGAPEYDSLSHSDNGLAFFYLGGSTPSLSQYINGNENATHTSRGLAVGTTIYRTQGVAVGSPGGTASYPGGSVQVWRWGP